MSSYVRNARRCTIVLLVLLLVVPTSLVGGARAPPIPSGPRASRATSSPLPSWGTPAAMSHSFPPSGADPPQGVYLRSTIPVGTAPTNVSIDRGNGLLYVTNFGPPFGTTGNSVTIISGQNDTVVRTVGAGDDPLSSTYDPVDGYVYVENFGTTRNLTVINGTRVIGAVPVGSAPTMGAFDARDGDLYVPNSASGNLSVVNGTSVVATLSMGGVNSLPCYAGYDPLNGYVYVANLGGNNVTVVDGTHVIANITVGASPCHVTVDTTNGLVYVPNSAASNVSIINGTTFVGNVSDGVGGRESVFDPQNGYVYVLNEVSNTITVINGTKDLGNITGGGSPRSGAFDAANGCIYVVNWGNSSATVIHGTRVVATVSIQLHPYSALYDPQSRQVYVPDYDSNNVSAIGDSAGNYTVTFNEKGLPGGTPWNITFANTTLPSNGTSIVFPSGNGTFPFAVPPVPGFNATRGGNVTVNGDDPTANITFSPTYAVDFRETGLPVNTMWTVVLGGLTNSSLGEVNSFLEPNGSYTYRVQGVPGYLAPWTGTVNVSGASVEVPVTFSMAQYDVTANETGLAAGTFWSLDLGGTVVGTTSASLRTAEPNGTYAYSVPPVAGYTVTPAQGNLTLDGAPALLTFTFRPVYPVLFVESGLPAGTTWSVSLSGGGTGSSSSAGIGFNLTAGAYTYRIVPIPGYVTNWSGEFTVTGAGGSLLLPVQFVPYTTPVNFTETGLPAGTRWSVTVDGGTPTSSSPSIVVDLANGSYPYSVGVLPGFQRVPEGSVVVTGQVPEISVPLTFVPIASPTFPVTFVESGLPVGMPWSVHLGGVYFNGTTSSLGGPEPNGTYSYTIAPVPGFGAVAGGSVTVAGAPVEVQLAFQPFTYAVRFVESGLPSGTTWGVVMDGHTYTGAGSTLSVPEPNATYSYQLTSVPGYTPSNTSGTVTVQGSSPTINISFASTSGTTSSGLLSSTTTRLLLVIVVLGVVALLVLLLVRRRRAAAAPAEETTRVGPDGPESTGTGYVPEEYGGGNGEVPTEGGGWEPPPPQALGRNPRASPVEPIPRARRSTG